MINASECVFEDVYENPEYGETVYYFEHPKDMSLADFCSEEEYGNVVHMCISITETDYGDVYLEVSPTVEYEGNMFDVDWRDLYQDIHYTDEIVNELLRKAKEAEEKENGEKNGA